MPKNHKKTSFALISGPDQSVTQIDIVKVGEVLDVPVMHHVLEHVLLLVPIECVTTTFSSD